MPDSKMAPMLEAEAEIMMEQWEEFIGKADAENEN